MFFQFTHRQKFYLFFKRAIAIFGSLIGSILCAVFLWWWILLINVFATKGHPIYAQKRLGKNKKVFRLLKFRSMKYGSVEMPPSEMDDADRKKMETGFGSFLRKTSLDETLQLLNIFVGQMAFVGPRPGAAANEEELVRLRESYDPSAFRVRPGLTGYAQVKMKRGHDPAEKAKCDSEYVKKLSFSLDFRLFFSSFFNPFVN